MNARSPVQPPVPPHDLEAEASVLGALLLDPSAIARIVDLIEQADFFRENHGQIYRAAVTLFRDGRPIDNVMLAGELEKMGVLERVGGRAHLALLREQTPTAANVEHYARQVKDLAEKRSMVIAGSRLIELARDPSLSAAEAAERAQAEDQGSQRGWEAPIPVGATRDLPRFPLEVLPAWLGDFAWHVAQATQTPADLAGMLALDVLAACAGGHVRLRVRPGWVEPLNLYTAVALESGERKSAVFEELSRPLTVFEKERAEERKPAVAEARARRKVLEKALDRLQNEAARATGGERDKLMQQVQAAARELELEEVPPDYQLFADDSTPETTATLLAAQRGRIVFMSPEGGVFGQMAGRYTGRPNLGNLDVFLKGHSGDMLKVNRQSRAPEFVDRPAVTLGLAIQPDVLRTVVDEPGFRGRGLLARFLYSLPQSMVGGRRADAPPVPESVRDAYVSELRVMARTLDSVSGAELTAAAKADMALLRFADELEPRLGEDGDLGHIKDWGCKLTGAVARLAGLIHLAANLRTGWGDPVSEDSAKVAIELGRYLIPHALAAFDLMEADPVLATARRVLQWVRERQLSSFSRRDCFNAIRRRLARDRVDELDPVLTVLEVHGWIRRRGAPARAGAGRPKSPTYDVHPLGLSAESAVSAEPHVGADSADSADSAAGVEGAQRERIA